MSEFLKKVLAKRILPAIVFHEIENTLPVAEAFLKGGLDVIEIPVRTPVALNAISLIRRNFPAMQVGAGTLLTTGLLQQAVNAGAQFGLSAGFNPSVCSAATEMDFPFIPGVMTPSEIEQASQAGYNIQKLFPAAQLGGCGYLNALLGPYEQLGIQFVPMGGINLSNILDYLQLKNVIAIGGSWLASKQMMADKNYAAVEQTVAVALKHIYQ